jgi:hypothetical protein
MIQISIDPAKMPAASALKPYLFPASFAVVSDDQVVQFVNRQAFPNVANWKSYSIPVALLLPALQKAREAARAKAAGAGAAPAPASAPATGAGPSPSPTNPREPRSAVPR